MSLELKMTMPIPFLISAGKTAFAILYQSGNASGVAREKIPPGQGKLRELYFELAKLN